MFQDEINSIPVPRSERKFERTPDSTRKQYGLRSAIAPSPAVEEEVEQRTETAERGRSAEHSTESNKVGIEEQGSAGPIPPGSDKRNEQKDSGKIASVAHIAKSKSGSKSKRKPRGRRSQKTKIDLEPATQRGDCSTTGETVQLVQSAAVKRRPEIPLQPPEPPSKPSNGSSDLTQEELFKDDIPVPESSPEYWDYLESETPTYQSDDQDVEEEDSNYIDPQEAFNRKWGYLPPLGEEATRVINFIVANPAMAASQKRIEAGIPAFGQGLNDRNVSLEPSDTTDDCKDHIQSLDVGSSMSEPQDEGIGHENLWKLDQAKITATSNEAMFQRTIMVSLIARHFLIYQRNSDEKQMFEFSVEVLWTCPPMPSRALNNIKRTFPLSEAYIAPPNRFLTKPKPDVAVAFNRRAIISNKNWRTLTLPMKKLASFEIVDENNLNIFHFLAIEAKNSKIPNDDRKALHQSCNCASQALFNFYEFFHDAGPEHEKAFFDKVRFFSIVANRNGFLVRIHRAVEIPKTDLNLLVIQEDLDYRLEFEFQELGRLEGIDQFSRSKTLNMIKKLLKYAQETMCPLIQSATSALCTKLNDPDRRFAKSRSHPNVYRHGQPGMAPKSQKSSYAGSNGGSETGQLAQGIWRASLGKQNSSSAPDESMERGQTAPGRPSYEPKTPSRLRKKRNFDDLDEIEVPPCSQQPEDTRVFKRQKPEAVIG